MTDATGVPPRTWLQIQKDQAKKLGISVRELTEAQALHQIRDKAQKAADDYDKITEVLRKAKDEAVAAAAAAKRDQARATRMSRRTESILAGILAMNKAGDLSVTVIPPARRKPATPDKLLEAWFNEGWALIAAGEHPLKTGLLKEYQDLYLKILRDLSEPKVVKE